MARIDTREKTLLLKIVYYGPALCGKTTNLQALHGMLDPSRRPELLSLDTHGDRTLFFDLLPLELEDVGGLKLKVRLFTVPGQVHYNATRRLVLRDADVAIMVADSSPERLEANGESVLSLNDNLAANGLAAGSVPIILQANKRDAPGAAPLGDVEASLRLAALAAHGRAVSPSLIPAAAVRGEGVFETFEQALRAALASAHQKQGLGRIGVTREALALALFEALAPIRARSEASQRRQVPEPKAVQGAAAGGPAARGGTAGPEAVLPREHLLEESVKRALDLAETLGDVQSASAQLARRVRELEIVHELSRVLVRTTTLAELAGAVARAASSALGDGGGASMLVPDGHGSLLEAGLASLPRDPMLFAGSPSLALHVHRSARARAFRDLETELALGDRELLAALSPYCTAVAVPVVMPQGPHGLLVAYGSNPEAPAGPDALRFLALVAGQAALGLQSVDRHLKLVRHGERLEEEVAARTAELRAAHSELAASSRLKDRILGCVNHELRTPLTKLLAAVQVLQRAKPGQSVPAHLFQQVIDQARHLGGLFDQVLAAQRLLSMPAAERDDGVVELAPVLEELAFACREKAAARGVVVSVEAGGDVVARGDRGAVTTMLAQLLDNAVKFTRTGTTVRVSAGIDDDGRRIRVLVTDEGPGIRTEDAESIFDEFDQGSADLLTAKPNGLGLGLSIARRLARQAGGDVSIVPRQGGAAFCLELPGRSGSAAIPPVPLDAVPVVAGSAWESAPARRQSMASQRDDAAARRVG